MTRISKQDWLNEGARVLANMGMSSLKIELLTTRLGVTKGSFYHHFKNYQDYKESLLDFIEQEGTLQVIALTEEAVTPQEKFERLMETTISYPPDLEVALRAWALQDDLVRTYQERIDKQRLDYVYKICSEFVEDETRARLMAQLLFTIYVGSQQVIPPITEKNLRLLYEEINRFYQNL